MKQGAVVAIPTETSYGLAAEATNTRAVQRVFAVKGRDAGKSVPLIVSSRYMAAQYVRFPAPLGALAKRFWPAALTLVVPIKQRAAFAKGVIAKDGTVAIRVSAHRQTRHLARAVGAPIVATSANPSGKPACYRPEEIDRAFAHARVRPDALVDEGPLQPRPASTLIAVQQGKVVVLRQGSVRLPKSF